MARLHYCAGRNGESAMTGIAVDQTRTMRLAIEAVNSLGFSAVRAKGTVRPLESLEMLSRLGFVGENRKGQVHGGLSDAAESTPSGYLRQGYNCRNTPVTPTRAGIPGASGISVAPDFRFRGNND